MESSRSGNTMLQDEHYPCSNGERTTEPVRNFITDGLRVIATKSMCVVSCSENSLPYK